MEPVEFSSVEGSRREPRGSPEGTLACMGLISKALFTRHSTIDKTEKFDIIQLSPCSRVNRHRHCFFVTHQFLFYFLAVASFLWSIPLVLISASCLVRRSGDLRRRQNSTKPFSCTTSWRWYRKIHSLGSSIFQRRCIGTVLNSSAPRGGGFGRPGSLGWATSAE